MTKLSVNINKFATLRNSRGGKRPDVVKAAVDAQLFGADGITVHPRPDERHITYQDVFDTKEIITTEFNIEGNPLEQKFVDLVLATKPAQVTLVPDSSNQITSNHGWDTIQHQQFLKDIKLPTLIINALDDSFLSESCHPFNEASANNNVTFEASKYGGHVGFNSSFLGKDLLWSENRILNYINHIIS